MPGKTPYNWPRFWHVPGDLHLDSHGFLIDPLSDYGKYLEIKSLDDVLEISCLVLLGEPGMGKSHAMKAAQQKVRGPSLQIELGKQSSVEELSRRLFKAPLFRKWRREADVLYLFLDALDEGRLLIETIHHFLIAELRDLPRADLRNRLRFRISCRTADWPSSFGEELKELWGEESFGVYQLAPLRSVDIQEAASQERLNPEKFQIEVVRREVGPLAARPVTLKMLLDLYREGQTLPARQIDLYERGCLQLCEEPNRDRRERRRGGELEASQRLEVASRIAAMMVFGNRRMIRRDSLESPKDGEISIRDLAGGYEPVREEKLPVGEGAIADVLRHSALFVGAGDGLSTWAHQTYSEFLAARYLVRRGVVPEKILALITHPEDSEQKLAPQLHEAAAWLAGLSDEVFKGILNQEPEVLLRSDIAGVPSESRFRLAEEFLLKLDSEEFPLPWDIAQYFHKLIHPNLPAQLHPYIADRTKKRVARETAIAIADRAGCEELAPDLLKLALSQDEPEGLRADAISALGRIADSNIKSQMRALAVGEDVVKSHFLRSKVLRALWPSHVSSEELFSILGAAKSKEDLRHYQMFLAEDIAEHAKGASIIPALHWLAEMGRRRRSELIYIENAAQSIMKSAWKSFEVPGVTEAFARMLIGLAKHHTRFNVGEVELLFKTDTERRRRLLSSIFEVLEGGEEVSLWVFAWPWMPPSEDLFWLLEKFTKAADCVTRELLARLIANTYDRADIKQYKAVASAAKVYPTLAFIRRENSKQQRQLRRFQREHEVARKKDEAAKAQRLDKMGIPLENAHTFLREFEKGEHRDWWKIDFWLRIADDLEHELSDKSGDLSEAPGWLAADAEMRSRLFECARTYILTGDPHTDDWINPEPNVLYRVPMAAYRAFRFFLQERGSIEPYQWKRWAPALLHFWTQGGIEKKEIQAAMLTNLTLYAGDEFYSIMRHILNLKLGAGESLNFLQRFEPILDNRLLELLWESLPKEIPFTEASSFLLRLLLRKDFDLAYKHAAGILQHRISRADGHTEALTAARFLVSDGKGCGWEVVWPLCVGKPSFGRELWLSLAEESGHGGLREFHRLPFQSLADLFLWLLEQFPGEIDLESENGLTAGDEVDLLRSRIIGHLVNSGTAEACAVLENLYRARPDLVGLRYSLFNARHNLRLNSYPWPTPSQVLNIAFDAEVRVVRTESELLDAVAHGFKQLQRELRQETPSAIDLWNEWGGKVKKYRPKSENQISDYVKRYLDRILPGFGVIVNREAENRPRVGRGGGQGERTDILVNVRVPESQAELTVIIETKGCWNDALLNAMETQLLGRYMKDNLCQHGLYLVAWFNCPQWDIQDPRWTKANKLDYASLETDLARQAEQLSKTPGARLKSFILNTSLH